MSGSFTYLSDLLDLRPSGPPPLPCVRCTGPGAQAGFWKPSEETLKDSGEVFSSKLQHVADIFSCTHHYWLKMARDTAQALDTCTSSCLAAAVKNPACPLSPPHIRGLEWAWARPAACAVSQQKLFRYAGLGACESMAGPAYPTTELLAHSRCSWTPDLTAAFWLTT